MIKVNRYEEGRVVSLGFESAQGPYTSGVVEPGQYRFSTEREEHLTVTVGRLEVRLPDQDCQTLDPGRTLVIPPGIGFDLRSDETSSYVCAYK